MAVWSEELSLDHVTTSKGSKKKSSERGKVEKSY